MISDLVLENFLSYRSAHLRVQPGQLNVVIGRNTSDYGDSNGSGKTSLLKALLWALYGQFPGQENADSVVNTTSKKDTLVRVFFQQNGVAYVVERYRKHKEHKHNIYLWEGTQQHAGDAKEVQAKITAAIGLEYDVFLATLVFTGEREDEFAGGTDKDQKRVLNALLPLAFEAAFDKAAVRFAAAQQAQDKNLRSLETNSWAIDEKQKLIQTSQEHAQTWTTTRSQELAATRKRIADGEAYLHQTKQTLPQYEANEKRWDEVFKEYAEKKSKLQSEQGPLLASREKAYAEIQRVARLQKDRNDTEARIGIERQQQSKMLADLDEEIRAIDCGDNEHCPTCGQVVQHEARQRTLEKLRAERTAKEAQSADSIKRLEAHVQELITEQAGCENGAAQLEIGQIDNRLQEIAAAINELTAELSNHNQTYQQHKSAYTQIKSALTSGEATLKSLRETEQRMASETNPHTALQSEAKQAVESLKLQRAELDKQTTAVAADLRKWEAVKTMLSGGKGGLHHFVFEQMLPEMTAMAQMFLNFFSANTLKVSFKSHRMSGKKVIEGFFVDASRGDVDGYGNLSRGEQRRINVAISLTLYLMASKHVYNPGILFLDEVADSLDQTGKQSIVELLEHFCTQYQSAAVLLTNERELLANVHSGYECVMHNGTSVLQSISES